MATNLPCDNHPGTQAAMLITNLDNGDTLTLCAPCIGEWAVMLVGAFNAPETDDSGPEPATEEAGYPEAAVATPDPEPKSEPEEPAAEERPPEVAATTAQETETAGE